MDDKGEERRMKSKLTRIKRYIPLYLMFLPGAIYLLINNYIPMAGIIINMVIGIMFAISFPSSSGVTDKEIVEAVKGTLWRGRLCGLSLL